MAFDSKALWRLFRRGGLVVLLLALIPALGFAISNKLAEELISFLSEEFKNRVLPSPELTLAFTKPVSIDEKASRFAPIPPQENRKVVIKDKGDSHIVLKGDFGIYSIELRQADRLLPDIVEFKDRKQLKVVDTSDKNWENAQRFSEKRNEIKPVGPDQPSSPVLQGNRWSRTDADARQADLATTDTARKMLLLALNEVGIYEFGDRTNRQRIYDYWSVTPELRERNEVTLRDLKAWGGAFLGWVVQKAGGVLPPLSTGYDYWRTWGVDVPLRSAAPGMVALFATRDVPGLRGSFLAGIILRVRTDCTEVVTGKVFDRVVITCVALPAAFVRSPV